MAQDAAETEPTMEEILASIRRIINEDEEAAPEAAQAAETEAEAAAPEPAAVTPEPEPEPAAPEAEPAAAAPEPQPAAPEPEPEPEDVLELTDRVDEPSGGTEPLAVDDDLMILDREPEPEPEPVAAAPAPAPEPQSEPEPVMQDEPLLDQTAAAAASGAFGALTNNLRVAASDGQTLEAIVRELMRPMLKEWLDANLPRIVEAKVEAEIERVARRS